MWAGVLGVLPGICAFCWTCVLENLIVEQSLYPETWIFGHLDQKCVFWGIVSWTIVEFWAVLPGFDETIIYIYIRLIYIYIV